MTQRAHQVENVDLCVEINSSPCKGFKLKSSAGPPNGKYCTLYRHLCTVYITKEITSVVSC